MIEIRLVSKDETKVIGESSNFLEAMGSLLDKRFVKDTSIEFCKAGNGRIIRKYEIKDKEVVRTV